MNLYNFRPHVPSRLEREWARRTGATATEVAPMQYGGHVAGPGDAILGRAHAVMDREANDLASSPYDTLTRKVDSWATPALERDLAVEKLRQARLQNELLDAQTPSAQDAAILTGRAGRLSDFAAQAAESLGQAQARGGARGAQAGADEAMLSPLGAHAAAVRHGYAKELAYGRSAPAVDVAQIKAEAEALKEMIRQYGNVTGRQIQGESGIEQALIRAFAILGNQSGLYTPEQRQTAAETIQKALDTFRQR